MRFTLALVVITQIACLSSGAQEPTKIADRKSFDPAYLNDSSLIHNPEYQTSVFGLIRGRTLELLASDSSLKMQDNQWNTARVRVALAIFTDPVVRNYWLHRIVSDQIENCGIKNTENLLKMFCETCTNPLLLTDVKRLFSADSTRRAGHKILPYKSVGPFMLDAHMFLPVHQQPEPLRPAVVMFHGGSWYEGKPDWMFPSCEWYASHGVVAFAMEYRLYDRHGVTPLECVSDAKSAIRWVRAHAGEFGVDPAKIAAVGFSAGGHLAACSAIMNDLNETGEDTTTSAVPNVLVLLSSCHDPTRDPWFVKQVETRVSPEQCSPAHGVRPGLPPTIVVHGTNDRMCYFSTAAEFVHSMRSAGNRCDFCELEGAGHFYFEDRVYREQAADAVHEFLSSLGFLSSR